MIDRNAISYSSSSFDEKRSLEELLSKTKFVIPSINGGNLLERMIPTLRLPPKCVIVLDQGSTDSTEAVCKRYGVTIIQLGSPRTYTESCNLALDLAQKDGSEFVFISNNDIAFVTDVARELLYEINNDQKLGALSCSQVIVDENKSKGILSNRVYWDLDVAGFEHDLSNHGTKIYRRESDFCEMTCSVLRVAAALEVGGFDDRFGFYHEDADLGLRLRQSGYSCAYLLQSQFLHYAGSTFRRGLSDRRLEYIEKSRKLFTEKHLGYGLKYIDHRDTAATSWNIINQNLFPYMKRFGLVDPGRPELVFSHPGAPPFDCLYSVWETSRLPDDWLKSKDQYRRVYVPSQWNKEVFQADGFQNVHYVPLGVETDTFHPWGIADRQYDAPTFLWFARKQFRKGLDVMMEAWKSFRQVHPDAMLIIMGHGIIAADDDYPLESRWLGNFVVFDDTEARISYREIVKPLPPEVLASIYRGVDYLVLTSRSEGFGFSVVEAMACGVIAIFSDYGATKDMMYEGSINFGGKQVPANYSDKNFTDVGDWWEPSARDVLGAMLRAFEVNEQSRRVHVRNGYNNVSGNFTWRHTCLAIRADLLNWQEQKLIDYDIYKNRNILSKLDIRQFCLNIEQSQARKIAFRSERIDIEDIFSEFDNNYYLEEYEDVRKNGMSPLLHFISCGWLEERRPSAVFDAKTYLSANSRARQILLLINDAIADERSSDVKKSFKRWKASVSARKAIGSKQTNIKKARDRGLLRIFNKKSDVK